MGAENFGHPLGLACHQPHVCSCLLLKLAENVMNFGDIAAQRRALVGQTLSLFQWAFMEALGFITFIAILLVDASSPSCELAMCMTTAFCVALFTLVIADGDDPYHGFIRVSPFFLFTSAACSPLYLICR